VLNIRPWEFGRITVDEFDSLAQYLDDRAAEIRKAAKTDG
jgi:hypothetical protein